MPYITLRWLAAAALLLLSPVSLCGQQVQFQRDIAPILEERCWYCHGEDEPESGLRLDVRAEMLRGGDSGLPAVVPGEPEKSYLIDVVKHLDDEVKMPPDEDRIPAAEIDLLVRWIENGAAWPGQMGSTVRERSDHWSFQPIVRPSIPEIDDRAANPIDAFVLHSLQERKLSFSPPADPRSLLRRASIVLTGLAPTPDEIAEFLDGYASQPERAYAALVDRLLASPHFGERWAQHWLDVIRWAETNGSESNLYRKNAWIYRDYVIRAFNNDKPYDQFLLEQIAGDTMGRGDATGYLVAGPHVPLATVGREPSARRQARADRMDEILQTVGASALGVTIGCARCHNHKFDPITISDYYSMAAVFQDIEFGGRFPELGDDHPRRIRGRELYKQLHALRRELRQTGPWEEDWTGFKELHFPAVTTRSVRVSFQSDMVRIDELEIFASRDHRRNVARVSEGVDVAHSEAMTAPGSPISRINDGRYGDDAWIAKVAKGGDAKPWIQFTFRDPQEISRMRLSTNRSDYLETDYLTELNQLQFEPYQVEVQTDAGEWRPLAGPALREQINKNHPRRVEVLGEVHELIAQIADEGPRASFVGRFIPPVRTFVFGRGSPENPRNEVFAAGLSELDGELDLPPGAPGKKRRRAFAEWIVDRDNPLTARVAANRLWHHVFGRGIVSTPSDFGLAGAPPSHPALLDWLAVELMQPSEQRGDSGIELSPWSMKGLIRLMVMSRAFRQSSAPREEALTIDGDSALLWRFPPRRVEAEVIRDSILRASGTLDRTVGGRSFRIHNVKKRYAQWEVVDNHGPETWRRMIYQERMRRVDDRMFTAFDFPDCGQVRARRPVSTTPLQALNLMNSEYVLDQSRRIAERAKGDAGGVDAAAVDRCFQLILGRYPNAEERKASLALARRHDLSLVCRALINSNEFAFLP